MKLVHPEWEHTVIFAENQINVVTVENKAFFSKLISVLLLQMEGVDGDFILSEGDTILPISKVCDVIINPFSFDFNSKKNLTKIYNLLKTSAFDENYYTLTGELKTHLFKYLDKLLFDFDFPVTYQEDFDLVSLFKAVNIAIDEIGTTLLERLINYIRISTELLEIKCFIFVNLKTFLSEAELKELYTFAFYHKIHLLLFEGFFTEKTQSCEKHYIIDNDLCEIF